MLTLVRAIDLSFTYKKSSQGSLKKINFSAEKGELILITGESGCGKSTLLRTINGLIPHFYEGELSGEVSVLSENPAKQEIFKTALNVGIDPQTKMLMVFLVINSKMKGAL